MRLLPAVLCAVAACWFLPSPQRVPSPSTLPAAAPAAAAAPAPVVTPAPAATPGCKPLAPIDVTVGLPDGDGPGLVRVQIRIAPRAELDALSWRWELSPDLRLAGGSAEGTGEPARGAATDAELELLVPDDGRRHRAELLVTGRLPARDTQDGGAATDAPGGNAGLEVDPDDGPELVTAVHVLSWGPLPDPAPVVTSTDAETGAPAAFLAVPARHTPADPAGGR